jgi:hypothetical protein
MAIPSNEQIKHLIESHHDSRVAKARTSGDMEELTRLGDMEDMLADDVEIHINGHDFHLAGKHKGKAKFGEISKSEAARTSQNAVDLDKDIHMEVLHVIGGENDEWKAVATLNRATTKTSEYRTYPVYLPLL